MPEKETAMTVADLIKCLERYDPSATVILTIDEYLNNVPFGQRDKFIAVELTMEAFKVEANK